MYACRAAAAKPRLMGRDSDPGRGAPRMRAPQGAITVDAKRWGRLAARLPAGREPREPPRVAQSMPPDTHPPSTQACVEPAEMVAAAPAIAVVAWVGLGAIDVIRSTASSAARRPLVRGGGPVPAAIAAARALWRKADGGVRGVIMSAQGADARGGVTLADGEVGDEPHHFPFFQGFGGWVGAAACASCRH